MGLHHRMDRTMVREELMYSEVMISAEDLGERMGAWDNVLMFYDLVFPIYQWQRFFYSDMANTVALS